VDAYKEEPGNPKYAFKVHFVFFFMTLCVWLHRKLRIIKMHAF
jgi:hypothetical protein